MRNNNYKFILADDHKGNKALIVLKGNFTNELVIKAKEVTDIRLNASAEQLKQIINSSTVIDRQQRAQSADEPVKQAN